MYLLGRIKFYIAEIVLNFKSISPGLLKQLKEEGNWTVSGIVRLTYISQKSL